MTISFDTTFLKVQECFKDARISELSQKIESITIIRDVAGKIRLFLEPLGENNLKKLDTSELEHLLKEKIGKYYGNDIWLPIGERDGYRVLIETIRNERVKADWNDEAISPHWYILERHIAKQAWTDKKISEPPWSYNLVREKHKKPAIISFFSFKGGVGRSSTLVAIALTLARQGHRVAMIDLDLEAPGLATIFSPSNSSNGVIDYLLEKKVQDKDYKLPSLQQITEPILLGDEAQVLKLLSAGTVDENYLEKLARLDFQNLVDRQLQDTMQDMLRELQKKEIGLDFILMDARAGFHDLGGLAITRLSHAVVIFGTQSRQSWAGLTHVIRHLAASKDLEIVLIHAMAPNMGISGRQQELQKFREQAYDLFKENYYTEDEIVSNSNDKDAPFKPFVVEYQDILRGDIALFSHNESTEESDRLSGIVDLMTRSPYKEIAYKLCELFERNFEKKKE
jgi:MinD-like ATPase involved in chromosome partitioning or flagellar assembly